MFYVKLVDLSATYQMPFAVCRSDVCFLKSEGGLKGPPALNRTFQSPPGIGLRKVTTLNTWMDFVLRRGYLFPYKASTVSEPPQPPQPRVLWRDRRRPLHRRRSSSDARNHNRIRRIVWWGRYPGSLDLILIETVSLPCPDYWRKSLWPKLFTFSLESLFQ